MSAEGGSNADAALESQIRSGWFDANTPGHSESPPGAPTTASNIEKQLFTSPS